MANEKKPLYELVISDSGDGTHCDDKFLVKNRLEALGALVTAQKHIESRIAWLLQDVKQVKQEKQN